MAKNKDNQPAPASHKAKKRKRKLRKATLPLASLPLPLQQHIQSLGIGSTAEYLDWCRQSGLLCGIYKTWEQMEVERRHAARQGAEARVHQARVQQVVVQQATVHQARVHAARGARRKARILRQIVEGSLGAGDDVPAQGALARRLLRHLMDVCPDILFERIGSGGAAEDLYLLAVLRLAEHPEHLHQAPETWRPRSYNARRRFASLARHLYGRFPVPAFLDAAWFDGEPQGAEHRRWFVLVGAGKNIRTAGKLPFPLTRKMAHYFLKAPEDYTVLEALRFGQVLGLGGEERLAEALRGTCLCRWRDGADPARGPGAPHAPAAPHASRAPHAPAGPSALHAHRSSQDENEFWVSVLRFFIRHPLDTTHVAPILDFLHHHRFEHRDVVAEGGRLRRLGPPQPNLSMRGRNPSALLRQVRDWHHRLGMAGGKDANVTWPASGIPGFHSVVGSARNAKQRIYTIHELTSGAQLIADGRGMHHCVATYVRWCRTGQTSIWSLQVEQERGPIRMLTIEVDPGQRRIIQARGRWNDRPTDLGRKVMVRWAAAAGLTIASWV